MFLLHAWAFVWASHTQPISYNTPPCEVKTICSFCFSMINYDKSFCLDQQRCFIVSLKTLSSKNPVGKIPRSKEKRVHHTFYFNHWYGKSFFHNLQWCIFIVSLKTLPSKNPVGKISRSKEKRVQLHLGHHIILSLMFKSLEVSFRGVQIISLVLYFSHVSQM